MTQILGSFSRMWNCSVKMCSLIMTMAVLSLSLVASATEEVKEKELVALTANAAVWEGNATNFSGKFPLLDWDEVEDGKEYRAKGLTLWGHSVAAVRVEEVDGVVKVLRFEILNQEQSMMKPMRAFNQEASHWKSILDKKLTSKGKVMPKMTLGTIKHARVGWNSPNSIVVLATHIGVKADRLVLSIYEKKVGLAQFNRKGQQRKDLMPSKDDEPEQEPVLTKEKTEIRKMIREISARKAPSGVSLFFAT